jgi:hypothetical protein
MGKSGKVLSGAAAACLLIIFAGCEGSGSSIDPVPDKEDGIYFADSNIVLDAVNYSDAGCAEVLPPSFANADSVPAGSAAVVTVIATACYAARVDIVDSAGAAVRSLDRYFKVYGHDGDKNRGHPGYLGWDGRDDKGLPAAKAKYRWRIAFNLGAGHVIKYYGPVWLD